MIKKENIKTLFDTKFIHVYDLQYEEGRHYYDASRRKLSDLMAAKTDEEFQKALPDGVTCFIISKCKKNNKILKKFLTFETGITINYLR